MAVHRRMFRHVEVLVVRQRGFTAIALDDVAQAIEYGIAANLLPIIAGLSLQSDVYDSPLAPRGSVTMISMPAALAVLAVIDTPLAREFETWLQVDLSDVDRVRFEDMAVADVKRIRQTRSVGRMLARNPMVSAQEVAAHLDITEAEAADHLAFCRILQGVANTRKI